MDLRTCFSSTRRPARYLWSTLKNRIHSLLAKHALSPEDSAELFSKRGRARLDSLVLQITALEDRIRSQIVLTPRVSSSGGKTHYGKMRSESNHYLMWAFIEAANVVSSHHAQRGWTTRRVSKLNLRIHSLEERAIS